MKQDQKDHDHEYILNMTVTRRERWLVRASSAEAAAEIAGVEERCEEVLFGGEIVRARVDKVWPEEETRKVRG